MNCWIVYKEDDKIIGFQIIYKDTDKKELTLERIAPKYKKSKNKIAYKLKLAYNEHLADIDIIYNSDNIKYIEIITSKGSYLKTGKEENSEKEGRENILYTSISKVDVLQKSYMPIIAFETTFSKDALKELFIYRAPVRFSKKRKRTALTVSEINSLKAAPNLDSLKKAKRNIELIRNVTMKSIRQLKALKTFQSLAQKQESPGNIGGPSFSNLEGTSQVIKEEKQKEDKYMEEQEFGMENEEEKDRKAEMEEIKESAAKKNPGSLLINLFKGKDSSGHSKETPSNSPATSTSRSKKALKIFSILRFDSLKKIMGGNSPDKKIKTQTTSGPQNLARIVPHRDTETKRSKEGSFNFKSPLNPSLFKKQLTIEDALRNFDSADESHFSPEKDSSKSFQKSAFGLRYNQKNANNRSSFSSNITHAREKDIESASPSKVEREDSVQTPSSSSDEDIQTFSHAMQRYESVQHPIREDELAKGIVDLKTAGKRFSEASSIKPHAKGSVHSRGSSFFGRLSSPTKTTRSDPKGPQNQERSILDLFTNKKMRVSEPHVNHQSPLDSAILKLYGKEPETAQDPPVDNTKAPIRRSRIYSHASNPSSRRSSFFFGNQ